MRQIMEKPTVDNVGTFYKPRILFCVSDVNVSTFVWNFRKVKHHYGIVDKFLPCHFVKEAFFLSFNFINLLEKNVKKILRVIIFQSSGIKWDGYIEMLRLAFILFLSGSLGSDPPKVKLGNQVSTP